MKYVGVDACRSGWFTASIDGKGRWGMGVFASFAAVWEQLAGASLILVDIPIGDF